MEPVGGYCEMTFNHFIKVDVCVMLQELSDVMKMELIADKQLGEIQQVRC
jgi:hypothetical protein